MSISLRTVDLGKLNALTRYPSIITYHPLDPKQSRSRGKQEEPRPNVRFSGPVLVTEKVDGANTRVVVAPDGSWLIGSRDEFLYASGDLLHNPSLGIVAAVRPFADLLSAFPSAEGLRVWYGEVYGGKVTDASRQYTADLRLGFRLFDVSVIPDASALLKKTVEQIGAWREAGGQPFANEAELRRMADGSGIGLTPRLGEIDGDDLPEGIAESLEYLKRTLSRTRAALDDGAGGRPEGIVLRSPDRSMIAKLRFRDYEELAKGRK